MDTTSNRSAAPATSENAAEPGTTPRLSGKLGVGSISLMIIAGAAPLCVVGGPMVLGLALGNGAGLPIGYVATLVVLLLFVVGFTTMTPFVRSAGAFYSYVHAGLGRAAGIGTGYLAMLSYTCIFIGLFILFGTGVDALVKSYGGPALPWWLWAGVGLALTSYLGYRDVELSGKVLGVLLVAEVSIVLALNLWIVARGAGPEGLSTGMFSLKTIFSGAPGVGLIFAVLSFIGIEAAAVFRDEARDPARTVRRATVISVIVVGIFYTFTSWAVISGVGDSRVVQAATADPEGLFSSVALQYLGRVGADGDGRPGRDALGLDDRRASAVRGHGRDAEFDDFSNERHRVRRHLGRGVLALRARQRHEWVNTARRRQRRRYVHLRDVPFRLGYVESLCRYLHFGCGCPHRYFRERLARHRVWYRVDFGGRRLRWWCAMRGRFGRRRHELHRHDDGGGDDVLADRAGQAGAAVERRQRGQERGGAGRRRGRPRRCGTAPPCPSSRPGSWSSGRSGESVGSA